MYTLNGKTEEAIILFPSFIESLIGKGSSDFVADDDVLSLYDDVDAIVITLCNYLDCT